MLVQLAAQQILEFANSRTQEGIEVGHCFLIRS